MPRGRFLRSTLPLAGLLCLAVMSTSWVRLNVTPSVPLGLYRLHPVPDTLTRHMLVTLPVPECVRPWHSRWLPLLKPVAGVAGDRVCQRAQTLFVNERNYGVVYEAAQDMPLPALEVGCTVVPEGQVFLASSAPKSLDSRYFSSIPIRDLTALATPLWVWK